MNKIDVRLKDEEKNMIQSLVGETLVSIEHDAFTFVNASSQVVKLNTSIGSFYLYSFTEPLDYFGSMEDVAVWSFEYERYKVVDFKSFIETPFKQRIKSISLVQENQLLYKNGTIIYDVWLTRGIIIDFGDHQLSFEKAAWLSEDIYIQKGNNLIEKFASTDTFGEGWEEPYRAECSREVINFD